MSADVARRRQAIRDGQFVRVIESEPGFNKWEIPFNAVKPYMSTLVIILQTEWLYKTSKPLMPFLSLARLAIQGGLCGD